MGGKILSEQTRPIWRTVLCGASVLMYSAAFLLPILFLWLANQRADPDLVASSAAMVILPLLTLPFTVGLGGAFLSIAASIPGEGGRFTVPAGTFTGRERLVLFAGGGLFPVAGFILLLAFVPIFERLSTSHETIGTAVLLFGFCLLAVVLGYLSMLGPLLWDTPPSRPGERFVGVVYVSLGVLGVVTGFLGGVLVLIILEVAIPVTVLVMGYKRSNSS